MRLLIALLLLISIQLKSQVIYNAYARVSNYSGTSNTGIFTNIAGALPIELLDFTAKKEGKRVRLTWTISSEVNNDFFTVQKSDDAQNFTELEKVKSKGNKGNSNKPLTYTAIDPSPLPNITYYRLKQTDLNGKNAYHKITSVKYNDPSQLSVNVYPNPNNGNFKVQLKGLESESAIFIELYDISGQLIEKKEIVNIDVNEEVNFNYKNNLSQGIYFIKAYINDQVFPFKISIEN